MEGPIREGPLAEVATFFVGELTALEKGNISPAEAALMSLRLSMVIT